MALKQPATMEECIYFTRRSLEPSGRVMAWVLRSNCPKCGKGLMGKPRNDDGGVKIRAKEYTCDACKHTIPKEDYEATLECNIIYTCPKCGKSGETKAPFRRKTFQGVPAIVFDCNDCAEKIGITKKMKASKKKGEVSEDDDDF